MIFICSLNKLFYLFYKPVPENLFIKLIGPEKERSGDFPSRKLNFSLMKIWKGTSFFLFLLLGEVEEGINFCPLQPCCCVTLPWKIQLLHCRVLLTEGVSAVGGWGWSNHKGRSTLFHLITAAINERLKGFASLLIRKDNCSSSISSYRDSSITGGFCRI